MTRYPNDNHNHEHDPVDRAVDTMRGTPIPTGPDPAVEAELLDRLTAVLDEPMPSAPPPVRVRRFTMQSITRYAAALLIVGLIAAFAIVSAIPSAPAFADVRANILAAPTLSCVADIEFSHPPQAGMPKQMSMKMIAMHPGMLRQDMTLVDPKTQQDITIVNIVNYERGDIVTLIPSEKVATQSSFEINEFNSQPHNLNIVEEFSRIDDTAGRYVRTENVDGRKLLVYEVAQTYDPQTQSELRLGYTTLEATLWVDSDTQLPVRMVVNLFGPVDMKMTLRDFDWGAGVDESLLFAEIPAGYHKHSMNLDSITETGVVATLKLLAEVNRNAFSVVLANTLEIKTLSCVLSMKFDKPMQPGAPTEMAMKMIAENPGWLRQEMTMPNPQTGEPMNMINIIDYAEGRIITFMHDQKVASEVKFDLADFGQNPQNFNIVSEFQKMDEDSAVFVRKQTVDGRDVLVYELTPFAGKQLAHSMFPDAATLTGTIWVDAETKLPIYVSMNFAGAIGMQMEMLDFEWDIPLAEDTFSMAIPDDYHKTSMDMSGVSEEDLITALKIWAEVNDNTFPDEFNQLALQDVIVKIAQKFDGTPNEDEIMAIVQKFTRGFMFTATLLEGGDFQYVGAGVTLGNADEVVCFFRKKDAELYSVIFGDLSSGTLTGEELKVLIGE